MCNHKVPLLFICKCISVFRGCGIKLCADHANRIFDKNDRVIGSLCQGYGLKDCYVRFNRIVMVQTILMWIVPLITILAVIAKLVIESFESE